MVVASNAGIAASCLHETRRLFDGVRNGMWHVAAMLA
jgi:hypothetical protein